MTLSRNLENPRRFRLRWGMEEKKPMNPALFAVAGILAIIGALLALYGLYNWYQSFGVLDRFAGVGGRLGQAIALKLQSNYRIKGSIGLVLGFFCFVGAGGAGFMGFKGFGMKPQSASPQALPPGGPPPSYGAPQGYGAPPPQPYDASQQPYGTAPQQPYGAPPSQPYGAPPGAPPGYGAPPGPPPGGWGQG